MPLHYPVESVVANRIHQEPNEWDHERNNVEYYNRCGEGVISSSLYRIILMR